MTATVISIQVGQPQTIDDGLRSGTGPPTWTTAFFKQPVSGPQRFRLLNIDGDGQADLGVHGGADKAVLCYAAAHYPLWNAELPDRTLSYGAFGENLTIAGLSEDEVCIGDEYQLGTVRLQVSQPRQPCWKLARRWNQPDLPKRVVQTGRSGWYVRVLEEGTAEPGDALECTRRPHPEFSITRCNRALYDSNTPLDERAAIAALPELSAAWKRDLL